MTLYGRLAEQLKFIAPDFYKQRFFKKIDGLNFSNVKTRNIEPEMFWLKQQLTSESVLFDIGSNVGSYIRLAEPILQPQNIYAFEPNHTLYQRLKRLFPKINLFEIALSDENKMADFKVPFVNNQEKNARGTLCTDFSEIDENKFILERVQVKTLENWMADKNIQKIDYIKVDVEGNEMKTLRGAKTVIQKFRPILMVEMEQRHHQTALQDLVQEIESWGFSAKFVDRENYSLTPVTDHVFISQKVAEIEDKTRYINNLIFTPNPIEA